MSGNQGGFSLHIFVDGAVLTQVLTAGGGFGCLGRVHAENEQIAQIEADALALNAVVSPPALALRKLSNRIKDQLLAPELLTHLTKGAVAGREELTLVLAPALSGIPWELVLNSLQAGGEVAWRIKRQTLVGLFNQGAQLVNAPIPSLLAVAAPQAQPDNQRHVTVLQYDLVNSTRMLTELGSEAYTGRVNAMHSVCAEVVQDWGGTASNPQGSDGVMCYFGLPVAVENAAANALRAGLEVVERVKKLDLQIRVGVVSGPVVVNSGQPYGMAIHLAARLQAVAEPGSVVVAEATRQIVRDQFQFEPLDGVPPLKGFDQPQVVHRLVRVRPQLEAHAAGQVLQNLVGRDSELAALQAHWKSVAAGGAKVLSLTGEAGIGKTSVIRAFRAALDATQGLAIECRCTPEQVTTAFYPLMDILGRRLVIPQGCTAQKRYEIVSEAIGQCYEHHQCVMALLDLMGYSADSASKDAAPELVRSWTLRGLIQWFYRLAQMGPMCLIVEDVHWIDPSTREFLVELRKACESLPLLMLMTRRVEGRDAIPAELGSEQIVLKGLARQDAEQLIRNIANDGALNQEVVNTVLDRADGVPLFVEESTRMMVDVLGRGLADAQTFDVPASLQDLLMARIDRMGTAKSVAQLGSVLGREFPRAVLLIMAARGDLPMSIGSVDAQLQRLLDGGLLGYKYARGGGIYYFRHALTREAAYQSLWARDRKQCHAMAAHVLRSEFGGTVMAHPVALARHLEEAGQAGEELQFWEQAARHAMGHSAHVEASKHIDHALELAASSGLGGASSAIELRLLVLLAGQLLATQGYGAERVGEVYSKALVLCEERGDDRAHFRVLMGLEAYHFMRADFAHAHQILTRAQGLIDRLNDPMPTLQWRWALANLLFHKGELVDAVRHMDACLSEYHQLPQRAPSVQDPGIMCLCYSALAQWELGHSDDALKRARSAIAHAEHMQHLFSQGEAHGFCSTVHYFRHEFAESLACAERSLKICQDGGFTVWVAHAKMMRGRALVSLGDVDGGIAEMQVAYAMWVRTGAQVTRPLYLAMLAEGLVIQGHPEQAMTCLNDALAMVREHAEGYFEPEILRLLGLTTLQLSGPDRIESVESARDFFKQAIQMAASRKLFNLEKRARQSLATVA